MAFLCLAKRVLGMITANRKRIATVLAIIALILISLDSIYFVWVEFNRISLSQVVFARQDVTVYNVLFLGLLAALVTTIAALSMNGWKSPLRKETPQRNDL